MNELLEKLHRLALEVAILRFMTTLRVEKWKEVVK